MDIDKLILPAIKAAERSRFGSLMDIDKLIQQAGSMIKTYKFWFSDGY